MEPWELHGWFDDFVDTCNRHDLAAIRDLLDPGVRRAHLPAGADAWIDDLADLFHGFPDWRWKTIQVVAEDDRITVEQLDDTTEPSETDVNGTRGLLAWTYDYEPGETREINNGYLVTWPTDLEVTGLD